MLAVVRYFLLVIDGHVVALTEVCVVPSMLQSRPAPCASELGCQRGHANSARVYEHPRVFDACQNISEKNALAMTLLEKGIAEQSFVL